jgi:hypothetical protein
MTRSHRVRVHRRSGLAAIFHSGWAGSWLFFNPTGNGQAVDAKNALKPAYARALQIGAEHLIANFLRVRLLRIETAVAATGLALVFLFSPASEPVALELIAATIRAQMLDFFDDHEPELLSVCRRSHIKSLPKPNSPPLLECGKRFAH